MNIFKRNRKIKKSPQLGRPLPNSNGIIEGVVILFDGEITGLVLNANSTQVIQEATKKINIF
jgi:hypothetical protein